MELFDWIWLFLVFGLAWAVEGGLSSIRDELRGIKSELRRSNREHRR